MPQNALVGWRFAWPKWLTGSQAGKQAVNKDYVDQSIANAIGGGPPGGPGGGQIAQAVYVNVRGDGMRGPLTLHGDPAAPLEAATKSYVDNSLIDAGVY
jgi:hypothetical protein